MFSASEQAPTDKKRARRKSGQRHAPRPSRPESFPFELENERPDDGRSNADLELEVESTESQKAAIDTHTTSQTSHKLISHSAKSPLRSSQASSQPHSALQPYTDNLEELEHDVPDQNMSLRQSLSDMPIHRSENPAGEITRSTARAQQCLDSSTQYTPFSAFPSSVSRNAHTARFEAGESQPYFRSFDTLQAAGIKSSSTTDNVVLTGYYGCLEVSHIDKESAKIIARLQVPGAAVVGAKIISCTIRQDHFNELRPLVALILHGRSTSTQSETNIGTASSKPRNENNGPGSRGDRSETRVEIRSLKDGTHISTLYKSPLKDIQYQAGDKFPKSNLSIDSRGNFVVVASGLSGEVFVFAPSSPHSRSQEKFRCVAKFWTSIRKRAQQNEPSNKVATPINSNELQPSAPIFSLSERWLAIAPPSSASRHSVQGLVPISPDEGRPQGVESVMAPIPPTSNCHVNIPDPESLTNKMAKGIAKEVLKSAHWIGAQGLQAWQSYWNKPPQSVATAGSRNEISNTSDFPPTHASHKVSDETDPGDQISIVDLKDLLSSDNLRKRNKPEHKVTVATFNTVFGCSFVSFSPNGLLLLTVSLSGDEQRVWDLKQLRPRKIVTPKTAKVTSQSNPSIRQVARFSRYSDASIVHVAWSVPKTDKIAMVTERGTIHVFNLPLEAFIWPARRNSIETTTEQQKPEETSVSPKYEDMRLPLGQPGTLSVAASKVSGSARPIVQRVRQGSNSGISMISNNLGDFHFSTAAGIQRGKALAIGMTKQIYQMSRASEGRFYTKGGSSGVQAHFLTGDDRGYIASISGNSVMLHWIHRAASGAPNNREDREIPLATTASTSESTTTSTIFLNHSLTLSSMATGSSSPEASTSAHPLSHAEIDCVAPFAPFHADRRITLSTYREPELWDHEDTSEDPNVPWIFGAPIPTRAVPVGETSGVPKPLAATGTVKDRDEEPPIDDVPAAGGVTLDDNDLLGLGEPPDDNMVLQIDDPGVFPNSDIENTGAWEDMNQNKGDREELEFGPDSKTNFNW